MTKRQRPRRDDTTIPCYGDWDLIEREGALADKAREYGITYK